MPDSQEALLRQLLAGQAATQERLDHLARQTEAAQTDAREARDLGQRITTILEEQNIKARLEEMRTEQRQGLAELRQDVVAANTNLKREIADLDGRVRKLEDVQQQHVGVKAVAGWLAKHAPWIFTAFVSFAAGIGLKNGGAAG